MSDEQQNEETAQDKTLVEDQIVTSQHSVTINGRTLEYTATAGTFVLQEEDEEGGSQQKAKIFFVAYSLANVKEPEKRPLTFSFNGGPGSSSVWMHMGLLGP